MFRFLAICAGVFATIVIVTVAGFAIKYHKMGQAMQAELEAAYARLAEVDEQYFFNAKSPAEQSNLESTLPPRFDEWLGIMETLAQDTQLLYEAMPGRMTESEQVKFLDIAGMAQDLNDLMVAKMDMTAEALGTAQMSWVELLRINQMVLVTILDADEETSGVLADLAHEASRTRRQIAGQLGPDTSMAPELDRLAARLNPEILEQMRQAIASDPERVRRLMPFIFDQLFLSHLVKEMRIGGPYPILVGSGAWSCMSSV